MSDFEFLYGNREKIGAASAAAVELYGGDIYPDALLGNWDADTNTPTLVDGTGVEDNYYYVNVAGTQNLGSGDIDFIVNDYIWYTGSVWVKQANTGEGVVMSVNGKIGDVVLSTMDIEENVNLYYTEPRADSRIQNAIDDNVVSLTTLYSSQKIQDSLSSLQEYKGVWNANTNTPTLVDGGENSGNFYAVSVAGTQDLGSGSVTYAPGDKVLSNGVKWERIANNDAVISVNGYTGTVTLDTDNISEGTNLYYTDERVRALMDDTKIDSTLMWSSDKIDATTGSDTLARLNNKEDTLGVPNFDKYVLISTAAGVRSWTDINVISPVVSVNGSDGDVVLETDDVDEGTSNLYYTNVRADARVQMLLNDVLAGAVTTYSSNKIESLVAGAQVFMGTWDALTNTPTLSDATGVSGEYYAVSVEGTQDLGSGSIDYFLDDKIMSNGTIWERLANNSSVLSVNGELGTVVLDTDDIAEGSVNIYYTELRVDARVTAGIDTHVGLHNAHGTMLWQGAWTAGQYYVGDVVTDGPWTMAAVNDTTSRAAPLPIGGEFYVYTGAIGSVNNNAKFVYFGNRYTFSVGGYFNGYRVNVVDGYSYEVYAVKDPLVNPTSDLISSFVADSTGWIEISVDSTIIIDNTVLDIIVKVNQPDDTPVIWNGEWDVQSPKKDEAANANGEVIQSDDNSDIVNFFKIDDNGGNRGTELEALTIGDFFEANGSSWTIISTNDNGTYMTFGVTPSVQIGDGVANFTFNTVVATPIDYGVDVDYWLTSPYAGNIKGLHIADGKYIDIVPDDSAYGVDILLQQINIPEDWNIVSTVIR